MGNDRRQSPATMSTTSALPSPGRAHRPLSPYDNNNEANAHKMKQQQQHLRSASNGGSSTGGSHANSASTVAMGQSASGAASGGNSSQRRRRGERRDEPMRGTACARAHLNSLWSVWYGFFGTFMQAYTAVKCLKRFLSEYDFIYYCSFSLCILAYYIQS